MSFYTNSLTGVRTEYTYTPSGAVASLRTYAGEEIVSDMECEYDLRGNQTKKTEDGRTTEYYYDALSRLKTALLPNGITQDYEFDDYGNIIRMAQVRGLSVEESNYCYDKNNRLLLKETESAGKTVRDCYTYDAAGNTVRKETFTEENGVSTSAGTEYVYNGRNQLCNVALSSGESFAYTYNAEGLRSSKVSGDGTVNYVYQNGSILLETDGDGAVTAENIWGLRLLMRKTAEADYGYRFDGHGDIIALTDERGTVLEDYSYDPYGVDLREETTDIRNWERDSLSLDNPFRYCGEYLDEETGLYYLRARYYDPGTGRFMQEDMHWNPSNMICGDNPIKWNEREDSNDPLGLNAYTYKPDNFAMMQSGNLYVYCMNNPVMYIDESGNFINTILGAITGVAGGALGAWFQGKSIKNGAIAGAIGGAIAGFGLDLGLLTTGTTGGTGVVLGVAVTATGAALGAFAGNVADQILNGTNINNINWNSALKSAGLSAGFSLVTFGLGSVVNNAFNLNATGTTVVQKLVSSLRSAGMADSAISEFLSTVFVEMPKAMAETIVNGTK